MKKRVLTVKNLSELSQAASTILNDVQDERVFAIQGKMGAGKTTLIKELCSQLGVQEVVSSPTFSLVNEYTDENGDSVFHFDFYRIKKTEEVFDIGYEEYLYSGHYCFIEWPEMIFDLLPANYVFISIEESNNQERIIRYKKVNS
jgi:tRNA threonylcarbamoyladenosine biosynthesis protein TsaE